MSVHGPCGQPVHFVIPKAMGIGSIVVDHLPTPTGDMWARSLSDFLYECGPNGHNARQYTRHQCPKEAA